MSEVTDGFNLDYKIITPVMITRYCNVYNARYWLLVEDGDSLPYIELVS